MQNNSSQYHDNKYSKNVTTSNFSALILTTANKTTQKIVNPSTIQTNEITKKTNVCIYGTQASDKNSVNLFAGEQQKCLLSVAEKSVLTKRKLSSLSKFAERSGSRVTTENTNVILRNKSHASDSISIISNYNNDSKVQVVGHHLINTKKLIENESKYSLDQEKENTNVDPSNQNNHSNDAHEKEIEFLLSKKSIHQANEHEEWFDQYNKKLTKLIKKEYLQDKASMITSHEIMAYRCHDCKQFITELFPELCNQLQHSIQMIPCKKHYFECLHCKKRDHSLGSMIILPEKNCSFCGHYNWIPCGKMGSGPLTVIGSTTQRNRAGIISSGNGSQFGISNGLILSASEWTTGNEKMTMADRVGKLS